jgi:hypothetical protein
MSRQTQMVGAVVRGLRARGLLSAGSVLLTALAVASAVLGPIFAAAVTNSYVVTRLREAPPALTGLSRVFTPDAATSVPETQAQALAANEVLLDGSWQPARAIAVSERFSALRGVVHFWSVEGGCESLVVEGRCPTEPGEVVMLAKDVEKNGAEIGKPLRLDIFEPPGVADLDLPRPRVTTVTVVGSYTTPETAERWLVPGRLTSTNEQTTIQGGYQPYAPAPLITVPGTIEQAGSWTVRVDTPLDVPPDLTPEAIEVVADAAEAIPDDTVLEVEGGTLADDSTNDLRAVAVEVDEQKSTARSSIAPAVLSLVLVALALLMRLLNAASEIRVPELALASLRGVASRRLWALGLAEPLLLLLIATPLGIGLGLGMSKALVASWLVDGLPMPLPWTSWLMAGLVLLAAVVVACLAVGLVVRESLASQLAGVRRPVASRRWSVVVQLALVAAAVAVLASKLSGGEQSDPDATDLVLPMLLAVVAGLGATKLISLLATWWTDPQRKGSNKGSLSGFVSTRAIARRQEGTLVILPVTAAIAVAVFGAGVHDSAATWRTSVAATASPAHTTWASPLTMSETLALTREVDPEGQWVMAAAEVQNPGASFAIVDADRLASVATWPEVWSPGLSVEEVQRAIRNEGTVPWVDGRRISLTVDNQAETDRPLTIEVRFGVRNGAPVKAYLGPFPQGVSTRSGRIAGCDDTCPLEGMTIAAPAATAMTMSGTVEVSEVAVDGRPVPGAIDGAGWVRSPDPAVRTSISGVTTDAGVLRVDFGTEPVLGLGRISTGGLTEKRVALKGPKVTDVGLAKLDEGYGLIAVDPVAEVEGMPFVGPAGLLVDQASFISDRPPYDNLLQVRVLQREGAPADVVRALSAAGLSIETTLAQERRVLDQSAYALALRLYAVVAALVLLMALAGLFVSTAVQLPARRRDAAALRVVGVPRRSLLLAVARELIAVLGGAAVAGILAGSLAQWVVLRTITLGYVEDLNTPALVADISPLRLVVLALIAAAVFGAIALVSASLTVRGARGATLRESAR